MSPSQFYGFFCFCFVFSPERTLQAAWGALLSTRSRRLQYWLYKQDVLTVAKVTQLLWSNKPLSDWIWVLHPKSEFHAWQLILGESPWQLRTWALKETCYCYCQAVKAFFIKKFLIHFFLILHSYPNSDSFPSSCPILPPPAPQKG